MSKELLSAFFNLLVSKHVALDTVANAGHNTYKSNVTQHVYHTVECTVTAPGPVIVENGAKAWITFLDDNGDYEGDCQLDVRYRVK